MTVDFDTIIRKAHEAGCAAADECIPMPMTVVEHANPFDVSSPVVRRYAPVAGGVCGFAWVTIKPANSKFAKHAIKIGEFTKRFSEPGAMKWISAYNQSYERKSAYAGAYAAVLSKHGINAWMDSRLD